MLTTFLNIAYRKQKELTNRKLTQSQGNCIYKNSHPFGVIFLEIAKWKKLWGVKSQKIRAVEALHTSRLSNKPESKNPSFEFQHCDR